MTLKVFVTTRRIRAETSALLDCGATENFIHFDYARRKQLPVKMLKTPRKIINVDGTTNAQGDIKYYTDLQVQQGRRRVLLRFFLTDIGDRLYPRIPLVRSHPTQHRLGAWMDRIGTITSHLPNQRFPTLVTCPQTS